jgi:hypothetical protein
VVDADFWPCHTSERVGGFHDVAMVVAARQRGAHVLGRLSAQVKPLPRRTLPDGALLAYLLPSDDARRGLRVAVGACCRARADARSAFEPTGGQAQDVERSAETRRA